MTPTGALLDFVTLFAELLVLLPAVSMGLALTVRRAGIARLHRWLVGSRLTGTLKGVEVGFVVPGIGAAFALVISTAGVNLPELALLGRLMTPRLLAAYTTAVVGIAIAGGYLIPLQL